MKTFFAIFSLIALGYADHQSIHLKGRLTCRGQPEQYAELQVVDNFRILSNEVMVRNKFTDARGFFDLTAYSSSKYEISPFLYVWHHCWEKEYEPKDPCSRHFTIPVPEPFISDSVIPTKTWNLGNIELKTWKKGEKLQC